MIRWFRNWRARRKQRMCARVARLWAECEAELLAEIGDDYFTCRCPEPDSPGWAHLVPIDCEALRKDETLDEWRERRECPVHRPQLHWPVRQCSDASCSQCWAGAAEADWPDVLCVCGAS